ARNAENVSGNACAVSGNGTGVSGNVFCVSPPYRPCETFPKRFYPETPPYPAFP
ncbi:hypothetical protein KI387_011963, partial [Taxus chinensis]